MLWIKEVEMIESVDDLQSSCSVKGIRMPDFEVLDARIASRKTDCLLDLRLLPGHWSQ